MNREFFVDFFTCFFIVAFAAIAVVGEEPRFFYPGMLFSGISFIGLCVVLFLMVSKVGGITDEKNSKSYLVGACAWPVCRRVECCKTGHGHASCSDDLPRQGMCQGYNQGW